MAASLNGASMETTVKILVVDDLPDRRLVYRTILEQPGLEIVCAGSGPEALKRVLEHEFAVILLDVNMPGMDGFEAAALIRARRRSAHTPIIFATAHIDEVHALRGYAHGAVDYILTPVAPEILRTKIGVFVELHRLNRRALERAASDVAEARTEQARLAAVLENAPDFVGQTDAAGRALHVNAAGRRLLGIGPAGALPPDIEAMQPAWAAALVRTQGMPEAAREGIWMGEGALLGRGGKETPVSQVILSHKGPDGEVESFSLIAQDITARRRAEEAIAESERTHRRLAEAMPAAVYTCDMEGRITLFNQAAAALWGREPRIGDERWCGSLRMYRPDGTPLAPEERPMAVAVRERRRVRDVEIVIERPDGSRRHVLPHPEPIYDGSGAMVGAVNMLMDITDLKRAEQALLASEGQLRAMFGQAAVGIALLGLDGRMLEANDRLAQILQTTPDALRNRSCAELTHPDDWATNAALMEELTAGLRDEFSYEKRYRREDGTWVWVNSTVSSLRDQRGRVTRLVSVIEDVSARKAAEAELRGHRERLEELVQERTSELEVSHQRLRLADRLAAIGTLAAGLGHDMGNLLLPIRMHLDTIEASEVPPEVREDVQAIRKATEYLQRLAASLRLLALDPEGGTELDCCTDLAQWWPEAEGMVRNGIPRSVSLRFDAGPGVPPVSMGKAALTQVVFNLVQNAGDALKSCLNGHVTVAAEPGPAAGFVRIRVSDDGPGMSEEAQRRCLEPFFTTKTRGLSTGLGLALVNGLIKKAGGRIHVESAPQRGTTILLDIPAARRARLRDAGPGEPGRSIAAVTLNDPRLVAHVKSILRFIGYQISEAGPDTADLWVTEQNGEDVMLAAQDFVKARPVRRAVVFGGEAAGGDNGRITIVEKHLPPSVLRSRMYGLLTERT